MLYSKAAKEKILEEIIDMEEKMFVEVNKQGEKADCQSQLKAFRSMRHMSFAVLSGETLKSYWEDLHFAIEEGRNLVVEKYARMDNLIPVISEHSAIAKIVDIESTWMQELQKILIFYTMMIILPAMPVLSWKRILTKPVTCTIEMC